MDVADLDPDPIVQFAAWLDEHLGAGADEPMAMAVATAGADGRPRARNVLLRGFDERGFVWFTNYESTKAKHLEANPVASLLFSWIGERRQVIVTGPVARTSEAESDAYFASRERGSQIGAWASPQSEVIPPDRAWLVAQAADVEARFPDEVPRPPHWGGYRLTPDEVELWIGQPSRLHDRFLYRPAPGTGWGIVRLAP